ncbi:MAG: adenylate kinase [Candidatus Thorarchaeota archaeon]|nr:MAG: adenylate kinase [Candidatus Thorarchaeota archaeon]
MGPTIILAGAPGVGKTSIISELARIAKKEGRTIRVINFGTTMKGLLESAEEMIHRDQIRKENLNLQRRIQSEAAREISKTKNEDILVVDTHLFIRTAAGAFPALPETVLKELEPSVLVLVEANPEDIAKRRSGNGNRHRDQQTLDDVRFDLEWSRKTAAACAVISGAPVSIVRNEEGRQIEAAQRILQIVKEGGL